METDEAVNRKLAEMVGVEWIKGELFEFPSKKQEENWKASLRPYPSLMKSAVQKRYRCTDEGCSNWYKSQKEADRHCDDTHNPDYLRNAGDYLRLVKWAIHLPVKSDGPSVEYCVGVISAIEVIETDDSGAYTLPRKILAAKEGE